MNLEWKAFVVVWHALSELGITTDVICFGKLIHFHTLNHFFFTEQFWGRGVF
jgi:hypothetical protein